MIRNPYDKIDFATAHNKISYSLARFIGPDRRCPRRDSLGKKGMSLLQRLVVIIRSAPSLNPLLIAVALDKSLVESFCGADIGF
jgi:hypothetical protein